MILVPHKDCLDRTSFRKYITAKTGYIETSLDPRLQTMIFSKQEFWVFILLSLLTLGSGRPSMKNQHKRSHAKDNVNTTTASSVKPAGKEDDGLFDEVSNVPHSIASKVEYTTTQNQERKSASPDDLFKTETPTNAEKLKDKEVSEKISPLSNEKEDGATNSNISASESQSDTGLIMKHEGAVEGNEKQKSVNAPKNTAVSLVKVQDLQPSFWTKPDGEDDEHFQTSFLEKGTAPEPPGSFKDEGGDLGMGQIPFYRPSQVLNGVPMGYAPPLLPFRWLSLLPVPPAMDISDRLPVMPEGDVLEEGSESALIENIDPSGGVQGERRVSSHHFRHPFSFALRLPIQPIKKVLKDVMDGDKLEGDAESKVIDILGMKMLLQKKVLKHPSEDASHMYVSVMSLQPLQDVDPAILKELMEGKDKNETESEASAVVKKQLRPELGLRNAEESSEVEDKTDVSTSSEGKDAATSPDTEKVTEGDKNGKDANIEDKGTMKVAIAANDKDKKSTSKTEEEKAGGEASISTPESIGEGKNVQVRENDKNSPEGTLKKLHHEEEKNSFFRGYIPDVTAGKDKEGYVSKKEGTDAKSLESSTITEDLKKTDTDKEATEAHTENLDKPNAAIDNNSNSTIASKINATGDNKTNTEDPSGSTSAALDKNYTKQDGLSYRNIESALFAER